MNRIALVVFVVFALASASAQDCSQKIQDFHKCVGDSKKKEHDEMKAKFESLKPKLDACYTDNGCTPPAKSAKGGSGGGGVSGEGNGTRKECKKAMHEAMKKSFEDCIKQANPTFAFPAKHDEEHEKKWGGGHKGFDHKSENKNLDGCVKKEQVRACKKALFDGNKPTADQKKAKFQAHCDAKKSCSASLGADCQVQIEKLKKSFCDCGQQQHAKADQIRGTIPACSGVGDQKGKRGPGKEEHKCGEQKDYCKLGFDAFVQDHPDKGHGGSSGGH